MSDQNPFADLLDTPRMYPWRFDALNNRIVFVAMTPEAYRRSRFLDHRLEGSVGPAYDVALDKLVARFDREGERIQPRPMRLVFHIGYTGSTLISRCIESVADALVLREPDPLRTLAAASAGTGPGLSEREPGQLLRLFTWLWTRPWRDGQPVILKATSSCNNLVAALMALHAGTRAVFVHSPLQDFLLSAVRHPARLGEARAKLAGMATELPVLLAETGTGAGVPDQKSLDDLQAVALVWWAYMSLFRSFTAPDGAPARVHAVDFSDFLADPGRGLAGIAAHFGLPAAADRVDAVVHGGLLASHAKSRSDAAFDRAARGAVLETAYARHRAAVDSALSWSRDHLPPLPRPSAPND